MIVVVGHPLAVESGGRYEPAGSAALAALEAARLGAQVQLVGKIGDDDLGDAVIVGLGRAGVGHAALLRDPSRRTPLLVTDPADEERVAGQEASGEASQPTDTGLRPTVEAADIELGLRYLTDYRCILVAEPLARQVVAVAADAAIYAGAQLIVVVDEPSSLPELPAGALVIGASDMDPRGAFAALLGQVAAAVDAGATPEAAFESAAGRLGATRPA